MPRKPGGSKNGRSKPYKWIGHIPVYFNDDELTDAIKYIESREWDFEDTLSTITQMETGIKFTYDNTNDCYHCTLQPKRVECYLRGYTLGFNHVDLPRLLGLASFVVEVLIEAGGVEIPAKTLVNDF